MVFWPSLKVPGSGEEGVLIANFDIGSAAIKPNHHETLYWKQFLKKIEGNRSQWKILGFTDCQGSESLNEKLRKDRAEAYLAFYHRRSSPKLCRATALHCTTVSLRTTTQLSELSIGAWLLS